MTRVKENVGEMSWWWECSDLSKLFSRGDVSDLILDISVVESAAHTIITIVAVEEDKEIYFESLNLF